MFFLCYDVFVFLIRMIAFVMLDLVSSVPANRSNVSKMTCVLSSE